MTKRERLVIGVAHILDGHSVYMGGPSQQARRNADKVITYLERELGPKITDE